MSVNPDSSEMLAVWDALPADSVLRGRFIAADGTPSTAVFDVQTTMAGDHRGPFALFRPSDQKSVVAWTHNTCVAAGALPCDNIRVRALDSVTGSNCHFDSECPVPEVCLANACTRLDFQANAGAGGLQRVATAAHLDDGAAGTVIVWEDSSGGDGDGVGVLGRLFDNLDAPMTGDLVLNDRWRGDQIEPRSTSGHGSAAIAYTDTNDPDGDDVWARTFDLTLTPRGPDFLVSIPGPVPACPAEVNNDTQPDVAIVAEEVVVVAWRTAAFRAECSAFDIDIALRLMRLDGNAYTQPIKVNTDELRIHLRPRVAVVGQDVLVGFTGVASFAQVNKTWIRRYHTPDLLAGLTEPVSEVLLTAQPMVSNRIDMAPLACSPDGRIACGWTEATGFLPAPPGAMDGPFLPSWRLVTP